MAISAAAGPISNLILALIFTVLLKGYVVLITTVTVQNMLLASIVYTFLCLGIRLNITLAVFNLFPVPPLDGSRILYVFLPPKYYFGVMRYERYISLGIMLLLFLGVLDPVISFVSGGIMRLLFLAVGL